tara:strand:+ start:1465 stop:2319 length:855 start_codon:yes stop_codon:yes gene_type:complete
MKIDTLILSGGGPSGIAYLGILKCLFDKQILNKNLIGIKEIITTSIGIFFSILLLLKVPLNIIEKLILKYDFNNFININEIQINDILVDFGLFETSGIHIFIKTILKNFQGVDDLSLKELYNLTKIKLTVKVFNVSRKQLEYISHETDPDLSIITLGQMTTSIPFFFKPVIYNNHKYVDGGLRGHYPIEQCKSDNYLGIFIMGGTFPDKSELIQLFPILEFLYSLTIHQDQTYYDIKMNQKNNKIIYLKVNYGLNFDMKKEDKIKIISRAYIETKKQIKKFKQK